MDAAEEAPAGAGRGAPPWTVLVVCTGNICRSPAAERLLTARLGPGSGVRVASAGTRAVRGAPVWEPMVPLLTAAGASVEGFAARDVTADLLREADLVLTMTRQHRSAVVGLEPRVLRRTFTLAELARITAVLPPEALGGPGPAARLAALVPLAAARRSPHPAGPEHDDIEDPYERPASVYGRVLAQIDTAVTSVAAVALG